MTNASAAPASAQFGQLVEDAWEFQVKENPLFATMTGDHRYDDQLPNASESDWARRLEKMREFQRRGRAIDRAAFAPAEQLNYDIFIRLLENEIREIEFRAYRMPLSKANGFHIEFPDLPVFMPLDTLKDYQNCIARLDAFSQYVAENIEVMRAGLDGGQIPPRATLEGVADTLRPHIVETPEASQFFKPFEQFPRTIDETEQRRLIEAGSAAILGSVSPGYQALLKFVEGEYLPASRQDIAAVNLPNGREFYAHRIRYFTSLDLSPEDIHQAGLSEVERIRAEMQDILRKTKFEGDMRAFLEFLRTDPHFYAQTPDELLKQTAYILKRIDGELPRLFKTLPRMPYGIRPVPDFAAPGNTTAYYFPSSGDGTRAGIYYVNTYDLKSRPFYEIEALSLHEAVPGHHLQIALQQELELPKFRRFGGFTSFVEGWALYAERLGLEMGFYQDPYSDFGRLSYEMWRACRLVVDTGMHALGWTRQQAIDFMAENTSSTLLNITNEIDRYIAWPGQALAYKIGELEIRRLRARAEQLLDSRFNLREFHDVVLGSGAVPLDVLQDLVEQWIKRNLPASPSL
jgi:uncharacterized protein (DUF885 family)